MRTLMMTAAAATCMALVSSPVLEACGAKFLLATRVARHQRLKYAERPSNVLLFQHKDDAGLAEFMEALEGTLEDVGHEVSIVSGVAGLESTMRGGEFDIVMLELEEARRLRPDVGTWSPGTSVLPMVEFATRRVATGARREFGSVLRLPAKKSVVLSTVYDAHPVD